MRCIVALLIALSVSAGAATAAPPTADEAARFVAGAETRLLALWIKAERTGWVRSNFITEDTEALDAAAQAELIGATRELATAAARFDGLELPPELRRKLKRLKTSLSLAAPAEPALQAELAGLVTAMESAYGRGTYCSPLKNGECFDLTKMDRMLAASRDPAEMLDLWTGWHKVAPPMRPQYRRFVELANAGARDLGFDDLGEMWRSGYDMEPDVFAREVDRLWEQVRPLYEALHCHVRAKLGEAYGKELVPPQGPIPAHVLGNMWAQSWNNVYDLVAPPGGDPGYDLTSLLRARGVDARELVRIGERFFSSLGFPPLPETFWKRSLFTKPADRDVVCHASAWDLDFEDDLRIKMCIDVNDEDFVTVHHELGHNYYQRAYRAQSPLFRTGAHDGFHEGIGDTIALSITPEYLKQIGLLERVPPASGDLGLLMHQALDRVAFLPFGLVVDRWRWAVFSGTVPPERYNAGWWELRQRYQGVRPPVPRSEADFDPGAKYHVPANTPYTRYFLAHILQFQFHRALCDAAGYEGPLHRCSIYGNDEAGRRLREMLALGASQPWPEALEVVTGNGRMDASALTEYFAPLAAWLAEQNRGRTCGW